MAYSLHIRRATAVIFHRRLLLLATALIVLAACTWHWLLYTESGARWIWARAQSATNGALQAQLLRGDIGSGLTIQKISIATNSGSLEIDELRLSADVDLLPLQIQFSNVTIRDAKILINAPQEEARKDDRYGLIEKLSLPLPLVFAGVSANQIMVSHHALNSELVLTKTELAGSWHDEIIIDRLHANLLDSDVNIKVALGLTRPFTATVSAAVTNVTAFTRIAKPIDIQLSGEGDLDELIVAVSSSPIAMSLYGSLASILQEPSWDLQAELVEVSLQAGENETEVRIADGHATSSGTINEYSLTADATIDLPGIESLQLTTTGTGVAASFKFSELGLRNKGVDLTGTGRITLGQDWSLESRLNIATFDLHTLFDNWPSGHPTRGELSLLLDKNHLTLRDSYLTAGDAGMLVFMAGEIDLLASVVDGDLRWENAAWPLAGDKPTISSKSGNISVDGSLDDWRINGDAEIATTAMPLGRVLVDGTGDRHHVEATIVDSAVLGGKVSGYAEFSWRDQKLWSAGLDVSGIEFSSLSDDWPEDVTGRVDAHGQSLPFLLDLTLSGIGAQYLGGPLSANGRVALTEHDFTAFDLKILHGDTRIELDGDPFARSGLTFDIAIDNASRYIDEAAGGFAAAGEISLHPEQLTLRIDADSDTFSFRGIDVSGVKVVDRSSDHGDVNVEIKTEQLSIQGNIFENINATFLADSSEQNLRLGASYGSTDVHLFAAGKLDDLQQPSAWQGQVRELKFELNEELLAELVAPIRLTLSKNAVSFDRGCIAAPVTMHLCAAVDWSADNHLDVNADLADVPVDLINRFIETNLQYDQRLNGTLEWSQRKDSVTTGSAKITMSAGTIVDIDFPDTTVVTSAGLLSFDVVDGQSLSGSADLPMPGFGHVDAQLSIPDFTQGADSSVDGFLDLDLSDMAVLATFLPFIDAANGEISADLALSGTLSEPLVVGDLAVLNGSMTYLPIGLQLDEINLNSLLHEDGQVEVNGQFRAGDGRGEIATRAHLSTTDAKGFELELRGNNMTLIDTPNISARADLDIRIGYDYKTLSLDGQIVIPHARVTPTNLEISRDTESEDVVIVAGELADDSGRQPHDQGTWINGSIGVEFGDDVSIELERATAKLTGNAVFSWEDDLIPIADGQYDLTGSIHAFGQVLEITEGGLRFPNIPADNPFVRIRAEREIYGNAQVGTAGVLVDGTLKQPLIEPYTRPLTTEERALALLVTGSDFNFEQGVGAIDFGTYIAPKVFVSYGLGLFETENVIRIRYDLKRGFGITGTSGDKETGVDLTYRIER